MTPIFFIKQSDFRKWLEKNHEKETELIVGFYKVNSGKPSITWPQSVDEAICFGWIDSVRKSLDKDSYQIRFTPRKSSSIWSGVNISKVAILSEQKLMHPAGLASFERRTESKSRIYAFENRERQFSSEFETIFRANKKAWAYYQSLAPSYKKTSSNWVMSAKRETTQLKRLLELISESEAGTNRWKDNKYN